MFSTREELHHYLNATDTFHHLYTTLHASTPTMAVSAHEDDTLAGLRFEQVTTSRDRTKGTITIDPTTGALTVFATTITAERWFNALDSLAHVGAQHDATPVDADAPAWSWQPGSRTAPLFVGTLTTSGLTLTTAIERTTGSAIPHSDAELTITPTNRSACTHAWQRGASFFHTLLTGAPAPAYGAATPLPAHEPEDAQPTTDYVAAAATVRQALNLLHDNEAFDHARAHDILWPTDEEGDAVRALMHLRDVLAATPAAHHE